MFGLSQTKGDHQRITSPMTEMDTLGYYASRSRFSDPGANASMLEDIQCNLANLRSAIKVTSENFGDLLIQGLEEAVAVEEGRAKPARVSRRKITARKADVAPPPSYTRVNIERTVFLPGSWRVVVWT